MGRLEEVLAAVDNARRVVGRNASDLFSDPAGHLTKITDALRNTNARVAPVISNGELTKRPLSPAEQTEQTLGSLDFGGGLGVIKPKGGNWLSGKYGPEAALKGLRRYAEPSVIAALERNIANPETSSVALTPEIMTNWQNELDFLTKNQALNQWIEGPLTKYVKNDMASPNDPIRALADKFPAEKAAKLAEAEAKVNALRQKQQAQAATRGVPEEYLTRTRQDVLAAEEARDLIAENQGLHYVPPYTTNPSSAVKNRRATGGFPAEGLAQTDLAKAWENTADSVLGRSTAKDFQYPLNLQEDSWLAKVDPSTPVYNIKDAAYEPGFSHIVDELHNSLREGRLSPEVLGKMNMEQAVRHVAEINALRAVEANKAHAMDMADIPLHKDYPEAGMSWRALRPQAASEDSRVVPNEGMGGYKLVDAQGHDLGVYGETAEELRAGGGNRAQLEKWLKQEGDAMGHCVGGYCDDVVSGRSNIFSLRDAKGRPHVTIETAPKSTTIDPDIENAMWDDATERVMAQGVEPGSSEFDAMFDAVLEELKTSHARQLADTSDNPRIVQIKGKGNAAPNAKYLPFIQDFIRSGKWSDIGDAGNTGLTPEEINQLLGR